MHLADLPVTCCQLNAKLCVGPVLSALAQNFHAELVDWHYRTISPELDSAVYMSAERHVHTATILETRVICREDSPGVDEATSFSDSPHHLLSY